MARDLPVDQLALGQRQWAEHHAGAEHLGVVTSVVRAQQLLLARLNALLAPFDLSFARYEALSLLSFTRHGALSLGTLGERLMVHPTSITSLIDGLEAQGLVARVPHPQDRRRTLAQLTDAGRACCREATQALVDARFGLEGLEPAEAEQVVRDLARVRHELGDHVDPTPTSQAPGSPNGAPAAHEAPASDEAG